MKRISRLGMIALALLALPAVGQKTTAPTESAPKAAACPWLALGTASRLLGVSATVQVQSADGRSGSCLFVPVVTETGAQPRLLVTVSMTAPQPCSGRVKLLRGIGNEAEECGNSRAREVILTGRVRDRWFAMDGTNLPPESVRAPVPRWKGEPTLPAPLEVAAEQVAGNLY